YDASKEDKEAAAKSLNELWNELREEAEQSFKDEGMDLNKVKYEKIAFLRYGGQLDEVEVNVANEWDDSANDVDNLINDFENIYSRMVALAAKYPRAGYGIMQVALVAYIETVKPEFPVFPLQSEEPNPDAFKGVRKVFDDGEWKEAKLYEMDLLEPGNVIDGLAIIEHPATTLIVPESRLIRMDERKFIWMEHK